MKKRESRWVRDLANRDAAKYPDPMDQFSSDQAEGILADLRVVPTQQDKLDAIQAAGMDANRLSSVALDFRARESAVAEIDDETADVALAMAKAGIEALGGRAHVHMMGAQRLDGDPTSGHRGCRMTVVQVTVTRLVEV